MTREEIAAAIAPDPDKPYRTVKLPGGWFAVAGEERCPHSTKREAEEWVRLRREDDRKGGAE